MTQAWAQSGAQDCLDADPHQKDILQHFTWISNDPELKIDFCDPQNFAYRLAKALLFLKSTSQLKPVSKEARLDPFYLGVLGSDPFQFFANRIHTFQFEPNGEDYGCDNYTAAWVNAAFKSPVMHICHQLEGQDELTVTSTLVHEARHLDSYHQHAICKHGFMIGQSACDESYSSADSYAVQTEYLVKVSRSRDIDPTTRQNARSEALDYLTNRFNSLPLGIKRGALLRTSDSRLVFYDGVSTTPLMPLSSPQARVYQSADTLKIYDPIQRILSESYDGVNLLTVATHHDMSRGNGQFVDRYYTQTADCWLYSNRLICDFPGMKVNLPITDFTPLGFQSYSLSDPSEKKVRIVSKERQVYSVSAFSNHFEKEPSDYLNTGAWNDSTQIGLSFDGKVYFESSSTPSNPSQPSRVLAPGLDPNETYVQMIAPYFWSKELQKL